MMGCGYCTYYYTQVVPTTMFAALFGVATFTFTLGTLSDMNLRRFHIATITVLPGGDNVQIMMLNGKVHVVPIA